MRRLSSREGRRSILPWIVRQVTSTRGQSGGRKRSGRATLFWTESVAAILSVLGWDLYWASLLAERRAELETRQGIAVWVPEAPEGSDVTIVDVTPKALADASN